MYSSHVLGCGDTTDRSAVGLQKDVLVCYAEEASDADSTQADASREELPDGEPMAQAASEPTSFPRPAAQLSLHEARDLLDKDHYGLDKVAS